jgi:hypothetical protein
VKWNFYFLLLFQQMLTPTKLPTAHLDPPALRRYVLLINRFHRKDPRVSFKATVLNPM